VRVRHRNIARQRSERRREIQRRRPGRTRVVAGLQVQAPILRRSSGHASEHRCRPAAHLTADTDSRQQSKSPELQKFAGKAAAPVTE